MYLKFKNAISQVILFKIGKIYIYFGKNKIPPTPLEKEIHMSYEKKQLKKGVEKLVKKKW